MYFSSEPGNSLGIGLGDHSPSSQQLQGIFVQCVIEGTPAANDGRLRWNAHFDKSKCWKSCWVKIFSHWVCCLVFYWQLFFQHLLAKDNFKKPCHFNMNGGRGFDSHRGQKIFSLPCVVPWFPLLGPTPSWLFMGSISSLIYTSELILCSTFCVLSATRHNIHMTLKSLLKLLDVISFFPSFLNLMAWFGRISCMTLTSIWTSEPVIRQVWNISIDSRVRS